VIKDAFNLQKDGYMTEQHWTSDRELQDNFLYCTLFDDQCTGQTILYCTLFDMLNTGQNNTKYIVMSFLKI
jgi:hypothetical protein